MIDLARHSKTTHKTFTFPDITPWWLGNAICALLDMEKSTVCMTVIRFAD